MTETPAQKPFPSSESHADGLSTTPLGGTGPESRRRQPRSAIPHRAECSPGGACSRECSPRTDATIRGRTAGERASVRWRTICSA